MEVGPQCFDHAYSRNLIRISRDQDHTIKYMGDRICNDLHSQRDIGSLFLAKGASPIELNTMLL